ncbi:MAG: fasciclin domain-containing protein [Prevotella sp.]|nr:fasciclin domain-containing protein [Prevotella sp.]
MKYFNIYRKVLSVVVISLAFMGCTDEWNEHYDVSPAAQGTLWEAISSNSDLSNFARVVKACGYDTTLVSKQVFTVFAPTNANFSSAEADSIISVYNQEKAKNIKEKDNSAVKEFLQNHIALYNYSVSSSSNDSIVMMNGKYIRLTSNTFGGQQILNANAPYGNGILFTLDHKVKYFPNIFEYLGKDAELDSVAKFLYSYNKYEFDEAASVSGEIVDGKTVYLDSVVNLENEIFRRIGLLNAEDSTYWMVAPTNKAWTSLVNEYSQYFRYDNSVNKRDSLTSANARMAVLYGTVFSKSYNSDEAIQDSAMSVNAYPYLYRLYAYGSLNDKYYQYDKPFDAGGVFYGTNNVMCSNGQVMKADIWNINKKQTFFQTIRAEGETAERLDSVDKLSTQAPLKIVNVQTRNPFYGKVSRNSFSMILPAGASSNTMAVFNVPNTLSNIGYDIYLITAPVLASDTLASSDQRLPTKFRVRMSYNDENGQPINSRLWLTLQSKLETSRDKVDTFLVSSNIKIPYCSYGTTRTPQVKIILDTRVSNTEVRQGSYNRILGLDCIIFKPHED